MLSQFLIDEIVRLLGDNRLSQRKIAAKLGVSRNTVAAIASGRRGPHGRAPSAPQRGSQLKKSAPLAGRCARCGTRVYLPCIACQARAYLLHNRLTDHRPRMPPGGR